MRTTEDPQHVQTLVLVDADEEEAAERCADGSCRPVADPSQKRCRKASVLPLQTARQHTPPLGLVDAELPGCIPEESSGIVPPLRSVAEGTAATVATVPIGPNSVSALPPRAHRPRYALIEESEVTLVPSDILPAGSILQPPQLTLFPTSAATGRPLSSGYTPVVATTNFSLVAASAQSIRGTPSLAPDSREDTPPQRRSLAHSRLGLGDMARVPEYIHHTRFSESSGRDEPLPPVPVGPSAPNMKLRGLARAATASSASVNISGSFSSFALSESAPPTVTVCDSFAASPNMTLRKLLGNPSASRPTTAANNNGVPP
eukprot:TRINITY_DN58885_c0_g1_i1.p1 TRINITY_DN58885_c0_g1~~TRINITY_DN58885_c0_g1_i1.p1  ORF type:complete len:317 (+),score=20.81 TRINITY_DN58885_c0_g1_i1:116-1066(+)